MHCWNCNRELKKKVKTCPHCKASVTAGPSQQEMALAKDFLQNLPADALAELQQAFLDSDTADDIVGDCPKCKSSKTGDCEHDPEVNDLLVGRCFDCGQLWCTECDRLLKPGATVCVCWEDDESTE